MTDKILTQEQLKEILNYNPETGDFTWKKQVSNSVKIGEVAGNVSNGYRQIKINSKLYRAHRLAWLYLNGSFPINEIDHINHIKDDNRVINLREATRKENLMNVGMLKSNTSGVMGVSMHKKTKKWLSSIQVNKKLIHLYCGNDFFEAICARKSAENKYDFHPNHGQ
jgi:hypothetical protein